jgi:hypothetical protein
MALTTLGTLRAVTLFTTSSWKPAWRAHNWSSPNSSSGAGAPLPTMPGGTPQLSSAGRHVAGQPVARDGIRDTRSDGWLHPRHDSAARARRSAHDGVLPADECARSIFRADPLRWPLDRRGARCRPQHRRCLPCAEQHRSGHRRSQNSRGTPPRRPTASLMPWIPMASCVGTERPLRVSGPAG